MNLEIKKLGNLHIVYDGNANKTYSFEDHIDLVNWLEQAMEEEALEEFIEQQMEQSRLLQQEDTRKKAEELFRKRNKK